MQGIAVVKGCIGAQGLKLVTQFSIFSRRACVVAAQLVAAVSTTSGFISQ